MRTQTDGPDPLAAPGGSASLARHLILLALLPALLVTAALIVALTRQHVVHTREATQARAQAVALQIAAQAPAALALGASDAWPRLARQGLMLKGVDEVGLWSADQEPLALVGRPGLSAQPAGVAASAALAPRPLAKCASALALRHWLPPGGRPSGSSGWLWAPAR